MQKIDNLMGFVYTFNIHNKRQTGDKINPKEHHTQWKNQKPRQRGKIYR